jgi:hypothetical protein
MTVATFYPASVDSYGDFTNQANVVGNTTTYATGTCLKGDGITTTGKQPFIRLNFSLATLPANAYINKITVNHLSYLNVADAAITLSSCAVGQAPYSFNTPTVSTSPNSTLTASLAQRACILDRTSSAWTNAIDKADMRVSGLMTVLKWTANNATQRTLYLQKVFVDIDYDLIKPVNVLFLGEMF